MTDRFDVVALVRASLGSLRHRATVGKERRDVLALIVILTFPILLACLSLRLGWALREAGSLVGGLSLLAAALLAVVVQLASWRQRLTERSHVGDGVARRSIDEAVVNTLLATLLCVFMAALAVVEANIMIGKPGESIVSPLAARVVTAILVWGCTYLLLTFMLIVNLLFDAYESANEIKDESRKRRRGRGAA